MHVARRRTRVSFRPVRDRDRGRARYRCCCRGHRRKSTHQPGRLVQPTRDTLSLAPRTRSTDQGHAFPCPSGPFDRPGTRFPSPLGLVRPTRDTLSLAPRARSTDQGHAFPCPSDWSTPQGTRFPWSLEPVEPPTVTTSLPSRAASRTAARELVNSFHRIPRSLVQLPATTPDGDPFPGFRASGTVRASACGSNDPEFGGPAPAQPAGGG
jgi:hypothetical protein